MAQAVSAPELGILVAGACQAVHDLAIDGELGEELDQRDGHALSPEFIFFTVEPGPLERA